MEARHSLYWPLPQTQRLPDAEVSGDKVVLVRLSASTFVFGTTSFNNVFQISDNQQMIRLFLFVLQVCCDMHASVVVETVVAGKDWNELFGQKLDNALQPLEFRLWVAMSEQQVHLFLSAVAAHFSGRNLTAVEDRPHKRQRVEKKVPRHMQPVGTQADLNRLLQIYNGGAAIEQCSTDASDAHDDAEDGMDDALFVPRSSSNRAKRFVTDFLEAAPQFSSRHFAAFAETHGVWQEQIDYGAYITTLANGRPAFSPSAKLRDSGLLRWFDCGTPSSMILQATDLLRFCFPHMQPSAAEVAQKLAQVAAATGLYPDLSNKSMKELVNFDQPDSDGAGAACSSGGRASDPAAYSPIYRDVSGLAAETMANGLTSGPEQTIKRIYYSLTSLNANIVARMRHALAAGSEAVTRQIESVVREQKLICRVPEGVDGFPTTYTKLANEMDQLQVLLNRGRQKDPTLSNDIKMAAAILAPPRNTKTRYTPLAAMLTKCVVGLRNSLRLLRQQQGIFLFLWLRTFGMTLNRFGPSFAALLCGAPGGGKSQVACITLTDCVPSCFTTIRDGASAKALTVDNGKYERDFQLNVSDEAPTNGSNGDDASSNEQTKLMQTLLVNGVTTYERLTQNTESGEWEAQKSIVVGRGMWVACTNNPQQVPPAMQSRMCIFDVIDTATDKRALTASAAVATANNPVLKERNKAFSFALKFLCGAQLGYTLSHATGLIPDANTLLFVVFEGLLETNALLRGSLPARRGIDCLRLAESIMIFDLVQSWGHIGHHFNYSQSIEILYYRAFNFLNGEHIVAAYSIMQQTTSQTVQLLEVMKVLKELVKSDDEGGGDPISEGDYYVCTTRSAKSTVEYLKHRLPRLGVGICAKVFQVCQAGSTRGQVHVKVGTSSFDGKDYMLVLKEWINTVRTPAEVQQIKLLHALSLNKRLFAESYDNEGKFLLFRSITRKKLLTPGLPSDPTEGRLLAGFTEKQLKLGVEFLSASYDGHGPEALPLLEFPNSKCAARYVSDGDQFPEAEPSSTYPTQYKLRKEEICPVVVLSSLLDSVHSIEQDTIRSPIDDFFCDYLAILGGRYITPTIYTALSGPSVFAGVSQQCEFKPGHHVAVDPSKQVAFEIKNTLTASHNPDDDEWLGLCDENDASPTDGPQEQVQRELYTPGKHTITVTHTTNAEPKLAKAVAESAGVDPELYNTFRRLRYYNNSFNDTDS